MRTHTALVTLVASLTIAAAEDITVTTTKGRLRGERVDADMGQYYYAFKGVPYAKSPTKDLRFQVWAISPGPFEFNLFRYELAIFYNFIADRHVKQASIHF